MNRFFSKLLRTCWLAAVAISTFILVLTASLCIESFTGGLWIMHHDQHVFQPSIQTDRWVVDITSTRGRAQIEVWPMPQRWTDQQGHYTFRNLIRSDLYWLMGWYVHLYEGASGRWYWTLWVSWGSTAVVAAILPAIWWILWMRRRRVRRLIAKGQCVNCGYDLRASPNRCPECGTLVSAASS